MNLGNLVGFESRIDSEADGCLSGDCSPNEENESNEALTSSSEDNGNSKNRTDLTFQNGTQTIYVEIKNWGALASKNGTKYLLEPKFKQQFTYYLEKTNNMNGIAYVFKDRGSVTMTKIKTQFQEIFRGSSSPTGPYQYQIFDTFWNNQSLRSSLFPNPSNINENTHKINSMVIFQNWVETQNNTLFSFIKIK